MPAGSTELPTAYRQLGTAESLLFPLNIKPSFNRLGVYRLFRPQANKLDKLTLPKPKTDKDVTVYRLVLTSLYAAELDVKALRNASPFPYWKGTLKRLVHWHANQDKQAKKVDRKTQLERSSPLDGAIDELNFGILRLNQLYKKGLYNASQRQMAWEELCERYDRAKTAIELMERHIDELEAVAKVAEDRLAAFQVGMERAVTDWLLKDMQVEFDSYGPGIEAIQAIIKEHQQDTEMVFKAMQDFKAVAVHAYQHTSEMHEQWSLGAGCYARGRGR